MSYADAGDNWFLLQLNYLKPLRLESTQAWFSNLIFPMPFPFFCSLNKVDIKPFCHVSNEAFTPPHRTQEHFLN